LDTAAKLACRVQSTLFVMARWYERERGDRGSSLVEYALLVGLIAVVCVVAITYFGQSTCQRFTEVPEHFNAGAPNPSTC
jgi:Flp pilus assembly pilin Flp